MAALSTIAAIAAVGAAGSALFNSAKQKGPKTPQVPTLLAPPDPNNADAVAVRNNASAKRARAGGLYSPPPTLLTGPNGLSGAANVQRSTLLGE